MKKYKVFIAVDHSDTWRDPDDIHITNIGVFDTLEQAFDVVNKDLAKFESFKHNNITKLISGTRIKIKNEVWTEIKEDWYHATTGGSWARNYFIEPIESEE